MIFFHSVSSSFLFFLSNQFLGEVLTPLQLETLFWGQVRLAISIGRNFEGSKGVKLPN